MSERKLFEALTDVKTETDEFVLENEQVLNNENYFNRRIGAKIFTIFEDDHSFELTVEAGDYLKQLVVSEYMKEFNTGATKW
jgi:type I restriction enzyme R subunit